MHAIQVQGGGDIDTLQGKLIMLANDAFIDVSVACQLDRAVY
jgi:hypothetical protein